MTTLRIGIASYEQMKTRTMSIARGERRQSRSQPKIWSASMDSLARVLSDGNQALLQLIASARPTSVSELAALSGRAKSNLSRTLKTMERYGLVELKAGAGGKVVPQVPYTEIVLDLPIGTKPSVAAE